MKKQLAERHHLLIKQLRYKVSKQRHDST